MVRNTAPQPNSCATGDRPGASAMLRMTGPRTGCEDPALMWPHRARPVPLSIVGTSGVTSRPLAQ